MADREKREKEDFREWALRCLDVEPDTWLGGWQLQMRGRNRLTVYGRGRLLTYTPQQIRLSLPGCVLSLRGKRLCCIAYHADSVGIEGYFEGLELEEEET